MSTRFADLCMALNELTGGSPVQTETDGDGAWFARLDLPGAGVELISEEGAAGWLYSRVNFGPAPAQDEEALWGDLLEASFLMLNAVGAVFCRDPHTHEVVLQQPWSSDVQPHVLLSALRTQCDAAQRWRTGSLELPAPRDGKPLWKPDAAAGAAGVVEDRGAANPFALLCERFGAAAGLPALAVQSLPSGVSSFLLELRGVEVQVCHVAQLPGWVQIHADVGPAHAFQPAAAVQLAEANGWLLNHEEGAAICRRPITRDYILRTRLPLDAYTAAGPLLRGIQAQVGAVLSIRESLAGLAAASANPV